VQYNGHELIIRVYFMVKCVCVCESFRSNGFVTKAQLFPMDGHYRMNIINGVGHPRLNSVVPLVLCTVAVQWLRYWHCTTGHRDNVNPNENW
jgi:hypothetical protein